MIQIRIEERVKKSKEEKIRKKNRTKDNYTPRNNRRDGKPAKPPKHTPGRDHRKDYRR